MYENDSSKAQSSFPLIAFYTIIVIESEIKMTNKSTNVPHYAHMFLHRQGLKIMPSKNFIDKFKEFYISMYNEKNPKVQMTELPDNTAIFFINSFVESLIYCLDCNVSIYITGLLTFSQKITDYRHNVKSHRTSIVENVKKINAQFNTNITLKIKDLLNKGNKEYQEFIEKKKERFKEIQDYYKKFYGKENEWWQ